MIAKVWDELEQYDRGLYWYNLVVSVVDKTVGSKGGMYAKALENLSNHYFDIGDFVTCEKYCDEALDLYRSLYGNQVEKYRTVLIEKAVIYRQKRQFDKAIKIYNQLLQKEKIDRYRISIINNIGRVYEEEGKYADALAQYESALEIIHKLRTRDSFESMLYNNIANVYLKAGDLNKAWVNIKKAKKNVIEIFGEDCSKLIVIYNVMSGICNRRNKKEDELVYLHKALKLIETLKKQDSEDASYIYHNLGYWYLEDAEYKLAISYYTKAVEIRKRVYNKDNEITASSLNGLAMGYFFLHERENCRKYALEARSMYVCLYGQQSSQVKDIDEMLKQK